MVWTVRPWGLVLYQAVPSVALGLVALIAALVHPKVGASVIAFGISCLFAGALSCVPLLRVDEASVYVRNFVRRRHWRPEEVSIRLGETSSLFTRAMAISQLVVDDGTTRVGISATTAMSRARAERLLAALQSFGVRLHSDADPSEFPTPNQAAKWRKLAEEATREWEEEQEVWRRLEEHRKRRQAGGA